jgi:toxin CcdB
VPQFDVHRFGDRLVVDCQADLLNHLNSRFVVPLLPEEQGPKPARRLNPLFDIGGKNYVMATQFASAVQKNDLGEVVATLAARSTEITGAIDELIAGV